MRWDDAGFSPGQAALLDQWLPGAVLVRDHGWGLVETAVLEVLQAGGRHIVKAGGERDGHIAREIHAHRHWLDPWISIGRAPTLEYADLKAKVLVTRYVTGELVLDSPFAASPDVFRQAGDLLARFHGQSAVEDRDYEGRENVKALAWLAEPHRIAPETVDRLRAEIIAWPTPMATLVPTHGDWQPRNWLVDHGEVLVIDFGRAALRPRMSDFTRLAAQDFLRDRALETAFVEGYGADPREQHAWHRTKVREAIGTAVWAYRVKDGPFEAQGHQMIADVLGQPADS